MSMRHLTAMTLFALAFLLVAACVARIAHAQVFTTITNGTIAVTNTFQTLLPIQNGARIGCTIQNQSAANKMFIYTGTLGTATLAKSLQLTVANPIFNCGLFGGNVTINTVIQDAIQITGTAGDAYVVFAQ